MSIFSKKSNLSPEYEEIQKEIADFISERNNQASTDIIRILRLALTKDPENIINQIRDSDGISTKEWFQSIIGNISGDLLESGKYHIYRGVLNEAGNELLKIFDMSYDTLIKMHAKDIDLVYAKEQKETIRNNIKHLG